MFFLTRFSGIVFFLLAAITIVFSVVDTAPELAAANAALGDEPIGSSVKFRIGSEVVFDVIALAVFVLIGYFLWTSEIQQTWGVVIAFLLIAGSVLIRVQPLLPMDVARHSPGLVFWGAMVVDDFYPSLPPTGVQRRVTTYPSSQWYYLVVSENNLSRSEPQPGKSVVLNFTDAQSEAGTFYSRGVQGAQVTGTLAGTRTVLDYDHKRDVYSVPHMMVQKVEPVGARRSQQ
ncbi:MAG: hypothetical protein GX131_11110 [candidate division WS1 bacterium]|nr:hypothetical protein [candidate division WS1 bacterium]